MGRKIRMGQKATAIAMIRAGATVREAAREAGICKSSAAKLAVGDDAPADLVAAITERLQGRMIVASDRFLTQGLSRIQDLHPYQAVLCAGIMHDHYLRSRMASSKADQGAGGLTQILISIDASGRSAIVGNGEEIVGPAPDYTATTNSKL